MKRPFKYFIFCTKLNKVIFEQDTPPLTCLLETWEKTKSGVFEKKQTKIAYIDTRYDAKLRLWKYLNFTKKGLKVPKYEPYKNTDIGKSIPILG